VAYEAWDRFECRVERNTRQLLDLFDLRGVKATFFVLGWIAERYPALVQEIHARGHEVGSHGYAHRTVDQCLPAAFREEVRSAKLVLEDLIQAPVIGFRAASFSITRRTEWALEVLAEEGFRYDSSIFPIHHDRYGIPDAPRFPYVLTYDDRTLHEFPMSTLALFGAVNLPLGGGGYLRWFPLWLTRWGIGRINRGERMPVMLYLHPWEIDPDQPRIDAAPRSRLRHYRNLDRTAQRLEVLLTEFSWGPIRSVLGLPARAYHVASQPPVAT
jgi:polysaccharide deacetylase family protein (PEP-CTERM system associated)